MDFVSQLINFASSGNLPILEEILKDSCSVDFQDSVGVSALQVASANAYDDIVSFLLEKNASVDLSNEYGWTPLILAARHGHTSTITLLLKYHAKVNITNRIGLTPLAAAVWSGKISAVKVLLDAGAKIDYVPSSEHNQPVYTILPIMVAALFGYESIFKLLLENGASVVTSSPVTEWTPLMLASCCGKKKIVELLMQNGSDKAKMDVCGRTAIDIAILNSHEDVKLYLETVFANKSIHVREKGYEKILKAAQKGSLFDVKSVILLNPECVNATLWPDGISALMLASMQGHTNIVKFLIENGANVNIQDLNYGWTSLMYAVLNGYIDTVAALIEGGSDINVRAFDGYTVLELAYQIENYSSKIIEILTANTSILTAVTPTKVFSSPINLPVYAQKKNKLFGRSPKRSSPSPSNRFKGWINNKFTTVFVNSGRHNSASPLPLTSVFKPTIIVDNTSLQNKDASNARLSTSLSKTPDCSNKIVKSSIASATPNLYKDHSKTKLHTPKNHIHRNLFPANVKKKIEFNSPKSEDFESNRSASPFRDSPKMNTLELKIFGKKGKLKNTDSLSVLLEENLLHKHIAKFKQQEVDLDAFRCLKEDDFMEIGINSTISREKLIKILNESKKTLNS